MKPGIYYNMPMEEYRKAPGVSQSQLKKMAISPLAFQSSLHEDRDEVEDSDALILGSIVASLTLEPDKAPWWVVRPGDLDGRTKEGKQWAKDHAGEQTVSAALFLQASQMATSVMNHPVASLLLDGAKTEVSLFAEYPTEHGPVLVKARPDMISAGNCLPDLKTTLSARPDDFLKSVVKFGYATQLASYLAIWNMLSPDDRKDVALLIAVEKTAPFDLMIHRLDGEFLSYGLRHYERCLNAYAHCCKTGEWPGYSPEINTLTLPKYMQ